MKFNNRPNEQITTTDGRDLWYGRSCAVVAEICLFNTVDKKWYVLLGKRGSGTPDFQGYWGLPCGYLDWDETLTQAVVREVWEECGLALPELPAQDAFICSPNNCINSAMTDGVDNIAETPWHISDRPLSTKQNISLHYAIVFAWGSATLPSLSAENCEPNEVDDLKWSPLSEAMNMTLSFSHESHINTLWTQHSSMFESLVDAANSV